MSNVDWDNAPDGAEFYAQGAFRRINFNCIAPERFSRMSGEWVEGLCSLNECRQAVDYCKRPQTQPKPKYEYGVEYPTNGQKPDLSDDVLVEQYWKGYWFPMVHACAAWCSWDNVTAFRIVDERYKPKQAVMAQDALNKYARQIVGLDGKTCQIDVYRVLAAFEVGSHPVAHAIKKLLAPGMRHAKTREQDLREAIASIEAELLLMEQSK